jgi:hypothetical protein
MISSPLRGATFSRLAPLYYVTNGESYERSAAASGSGLKGNQKASQTIASAQAARRNATFTRAKSPKKLALFTNLREWCHRKGGGIRGHAAPVS